MQKVKEELPVVMETPNAKVRQQTDLGAATDYGELTAERIRLTPMRWVR